MAYPALLGRRLGFEAINLGFSGNARAEEEVAHLLGELSPAIFVLDPLPNMQPGDVVERVGYMVRHLRETHPGIPIVLVENIQYPSGKYIAEQRSAVDAKNRNLRELVYLLTEDVVPLIYTIPADRLLGDDGLDTVDGIHPTDVGFMRMADGMEPLLRRLLR
jgi:lysophospholipase L1-like esterase